MTREEILREFKGVEGINEAKKIYKNLAKKLHPDVGGDEESFKLLNAIYTDLIEHKIYFSNDFKIWNKYVTIDNSVGRILRFKSVGIRVKSVSFVHKTIILHHAGVDLLAQKS